MLFARAVPVFLLGARRMPSLLSRGNESTERYLFSKIFCAFTMFHKFRYFFDARRLVSSLAHCQRRRSKSSDTFLRVTLRLDKPSEDRLVLTKVEKNILCWRARGSPFALFGGYIHEITGMAATTWRLRPRFVSVAGDGAFLLDQDDFGARA